MSEIKTLKDLEDTINKQSGKQGEEQGDVQGTSSDLSVLEKCIRFVEHIICENDRVNVLIGRYWVEGVVVKTSKFGIVVKNPIREHVIRLGKIAMVVVQERGEVYKKFVELQQVTK